MHKPIKSSFAQRRKERKVKTGSYLNHSIHQTDSSLYTYKSLHFFATFAPLREQMPFLG